VPKPPLQNSLKRVLKQPLAPLLVLYSCADRDEKKKAEKSVRPPRTRIRRSSAARAPARALSARTDTNLTLRAIPKMTRPIRRSLPWTRDPFMLISTILRQCTDVRVTRSQTLYVKYPRRRICLTRIRRFEQISGDGFFGTRQVHHGRSKKSWKNRGEVPRQEHFWTLRWARKTRMSCWHGVWHRLRIVSIRTVTRSERLDLSRNTIQEMNRIDEGDSRENGSVFHQLIWHGRKVSRRANRGARMQSRAFASERQDNLNAFFRGVNMDFRQATCLDSLPS